MNSVPIFRRCCRQITVLCPCTSRSQYSFGTIRCQERYVTSTSRGPTGFERIDTIVQQVDKKTYSNDKSDDGEVIDLDTDFLFPYTQPEGSGVALQSTLTPGSLDPDVIKEEVTQALMEHAPNYDDEVEEDELTPAQIFYRENRERLLAQAQEHLLSKRAAMDEYEWSYHNEPVVRPPKGHLWSMEDDDERPREYALDWPKGQLPTVDMIVELLRHEEARDIVVIDLNEVERRDVGTHAIICTGHTTRHSRRLGNLVSKTIQKLEVPHTASYCFGTRNDEWVLAHVGPICVHMFTPYSRTQYQLEMLYNDPNHFFPPNEFPHYPLDDLPFDIRIGELRSTTAMLRPYDDSLYKKFIESDSSQEKDLDDAMHDMDPEIIEPEKIVQDR